MIFERVFENFRVVAGSTNIYQSQVSLEVTDREGGEVFPKKKLNYGGPLGSVIHPVTLILF